jgi:hypothetical protein
MSNGFEQHGITHLSASQVNLYLACPSLWVMEKLLKKRGGVGCAAHRGTAAEAGISAGLFDVAMTPEDCLAVSLPIYDRLTALSGDPKRDAERAVIPGMIAQGLSLREHGLPMRPNEGDQHRIEIRLEGVSVPIVGFLDWMYPTEVLDLKTTLRVPSEMGATHLRQASIYKTAHMDKRVRFFYASDKKSIKHTLTREQYDQAVKEITLTAQRMERFLGLSKDARELAALVPHDSSSFYFNDPAVKAAAVEIYGF